MYIFPLAGAKHRSTSAQAMTLALVPDQPLELRREPSNQYDSSAIQVLSVMSGERESECIGYVPKHIAAELALKMDTVEWSYHCSVRHPNAKIPMLQVWADNEEAPKPRSLKNETASEVPF